VLSKRKECQPTCKLAGLLLLLLPLLLLLLLLLASVLPPATSLLQVALLLCSARAWACESEGSCHCPCCSGWRDACCSVSRGSALPPCAAVLVLMPLM
jgi:hypothetical protein